MKIIHITASYKPAYTYGGPIQSVGKLCEAFQKTDAERGEPKNSIIVLTTSANGNNELNVQLAKPVLVDGVSVTYFKRWTKDHSHLSPGLLLRLWRTVKEPQPDNEKIIIHIHAWWNLVSVLTCLIAALKTMTIVISPRGMLTSYSQNNRNSIAKIIIHKLIGKRLLEKCHIHATSEQEKQEILKIVKPKSIHVIANLVNIAKAGEFKSKSVDSNLFKLIFLSRIEEKKGLEFLFDVLSLLEFPWSLTIAGSGEETYIESLKLKAKVLKIQQQIDWVGQVGNECKFELMAGHDLLVLTSFNENFANVIVESLSVGTPVLISKQVGLSDYVQDKNLGWVCELTIKSIQDQLIASYLDLNKREIIKNTASTIVRADFKDQVLVRKYLEFYDGILA